MSPRQSKRRTKTPGRIGLVGRPAWEKDAASDQRSARTRIANPLRDHKWVTQLGGKTFRAVPRFHDDETDVSVLRGILDAEQAARSAFGRPSKRKDKVRFLNVPTLRSHDYEVLDTGNQRNPLHASIVAPDLDDGDEERWWTDPRRVTLDTIAQNERPIEEGVHSEAEKQVDP